MRSSKLLMIAVPAITFVIYLFTLRPTVGWVDSGEIATGCYYLNILHPTGYPLYTLIGNLFTRLPIGRVIFRVNLASAFFSALAAMFCFLTVERLSRSWVSALVATAMFAFSFTIWSISVDAEVFGLTAGYITLIGYLLAGWEPDDYPHRLLFTAYLLGLSLTNHLSVISAVAGAIVYTLTRRRYLPLLLALLVCFVLGLTPYLYLLIRSHDWPLMNWGNPHNLERLFWHITGKQYQVWIFTLPWSEMLNNIAKALGTLVQELYYLLVPLFFWGGWSLFKRNRPIFWFFGILFGLNIVYAANYSIPDIQPYYIPAVFAAAVAAGIGLSELLKQLKAIPAAAVGFLALIPVIVNYPRAGANGNYVVEDFARNYLRSMPERAIVITTNWDMYAPVYYLKYVEGERADICLIDKELLRRSWYVQGLGKEYPWLYERSRVEIERYLSYNYDFEHGRLQDVAGIQQAFVAMISSFITRNPERRAFLTAEALNDSDIRNLLREKQRIPFGLLYELSDAPTPDTFDYTRFRLRKSRRQLDQRTRINTRAYEQVALDRVGYLLQNNRREEAVATLSWVLNEFPDSKRASSLKATLKL